MPSLLIERYDCGKILFTGVAGGVAHGLNVGDVVVADRLVQHGTWMQDQSFSVLRSHCLV